VDSSAFFAKHSSSFLFFFLILVFMFCKDLNFCFNLGLCKFYIISQSGIDIFCALEFVGLLYQFLNVISL